MRHQAEKSPKKQQNDTVKSNNQSQLNYTQSPGLDLVQGITGGGQSLSPDTIIALQQTHGNHFVQRLIQQQTNHPTPKLVVQRFLDKATWITNSTLDGTLWGTKGRSKKLKAVDDAVGAYEEHKNSTDYEERRKVLWKINYAIGDWMKSKGDEEGDYSPDRPSMQTKRWEKIQALKDAIAAEDKIIQQLINDVAAEKERQEAEARDAIIGSFVTDDVLAIESKEERATKIFNLYMDKFRGTASYTLKTNPGASIYNASGTIACATIASGLRDAYRYAGLDSKVIQIPAQKFITKPVTAAFMDTATIGNVRRENNSYADEKRFFFTAHWIVQVNGSQHFDPTSGIPVSADGGEIIDSKYTGFTDSENLEYKKGDNMTLSAILDDVPSGSGYVLKET